MVVIYDFLTENYKELYGNASGPNYSGDIDRAWSDLVRLVNRVNNGIFNQERDQIEKKITNMKANHKCEIIRNLNH